jgi:hypothetical protein
MPHPHTTRSTVTLVAANGRARPTISETLATL